MEQRICKKCLLRDMPEGEYFQNMYHYIRNLTEDEKVPDQEYERRLSICRECGRLMSGMCTECGCFIEMRAALAVRHCPLPEKKW